MQIYEAEYHMRGDGKLIKAKEIVEDEIMKIVEERGGMVCIRDVAEALQIHKQTAKVYLFKMCSEGKLKFRKIGNIFIFEKK